MASAALDFRSACFLTNKGASLLGVRGHDSSTQNLLNHPLFGVSTTATSFVILDADTSLLEATSTSLAEKAMYKARVLQTADLFRLDNSREITYLIGLRVGGVMVRGREGEDEQTHLSPPSPQRPGSR